MHSNFLVLAFLLLGLGACGDDSAASDAAPLDVPSIDDAPVMDTRPYDGAVPADCTEVCGHAISVCPTFADMSECVVSCMEGIDQGTLDCINASTDCDSAFACLPER